MYAQDTGFAPPVNRVPANVQTENALLGVLLVDNSAIALVSDFLEGQHFFSALNGAIYDQAKQLIEAGRTATILTLSPYFEGVEVQGEYEALPIDRYLGNLAIAAGLRASMRDYGRTIVEASALRGLQVHCEDMLKAVAERGHEAQRLIEDGMSALYQISRRLPSERVERTREQTIDLVLAKAREAVQRGSGLIGLSTGLRDLDAKLGGLAPTNLIIIAGRPAMGKSALAAGIAHSVARSGTPAAIFSLEMSDDELYARLISERAGVSSERLRRGKFEANNWPAIEAAAAGLKQIPLEIDQTGGLTIGQLATRARRMHREKKLGLIVVDYLQLMAGSGRNRADNRTNELTEITNGLKALAKELDLPIIALSQLSRQVESRDDKRPQLSDLRESGSIEQDADAVIFVYREEYYLEKQEPPATEYARYADWTARMQASVGTADAIIGKARHGPTGTVKLAFAKELTRFSDLARGQNQ